MLTWYLIQLLESLIESDEPSWRLEHHDEDIRETRP